MGRSMRSMARTDTVSLWTLGLLGLCSCSADRLSEPEVDAARGVDAAQRSESDAQPGSRAWVDAEPVQTPSKDGAAAASEAGPARDAEAEATVERPRDAGNDGAQASSAECVAHADCALVAKSCCACEKTLENVRGVRADSGATVPCPGLCGACPEPPPYDPLNAWVAPACQNGRCSVHDLRQAEETRCTRDDECQAVHESQSCCPTCSSEPRFYRARRKDRAVTTADSPCVGDVACPACVPTLPAAFCAADGHCAVRAR
jgi:hypothetical protein